MRKEIPRSLRKPIDQYCRNCIYDETACGTWRQIVRIMMPIGEGQKRTVYQLAIPLGVSDATTFLIEASRSGDSE